MACEPPPPKSPPAALTTISALGDDLLREIFLRLPSLPTLVRAALACPAFLRAVRSSPAFRRRFRDLHSPPLLGLFLDFFDSDTPAFRPVRLRSDPDLTAAVRGADFLLTRLPDDEGPDPEWSIKDCHDGYVVLISYNRADGLAVYNPLTRALHLFPTPPDEICANMCTEYHVLSSEEDQGPFRFICVGNEDYGAQAAILSSETREWQIFPLVFAPNMRPVLEPLDEKYTPDNGKLVNGSIYWVAESLATARVLSTATMQFSRINLPHVEGQEALVAGETRDGKLCVICTVKRTLVVWLWGTDNDGLERWMLDKIFPLEQGIDGLRGSFMDDHVILKVIVIENGFVYLSAYCEVDLKLPGWFLSFCLETEELNKLFPIIHDDMYPYIMAWPPSLVLDKPCSSS
ncbi:uncharacterized protein LOC124647701 [Lolium rigidum]|uniref:uncharacterized protein LOC124647701 n=1 Tax=Lolium rigidum TaxID=89674 RepID=UPI001F5C7717|nr:uncharacterized protein LOC124647701 [Lolium rigidum]